VATFEFLCFGASLDRAKSSWIEGLAALPDGSGDVQDLAGEYDQGVAQSPEP
jgi:hypothetical protein